ncbi:MAG: DNA-3-methyladenine glycosylase [Sandaracinaceae bacterium]|nr:DNA-3-methyladenine glycosylase [Sandaracinaceae bacterium]
MQRGPTRFCRTNPVDPAVACVCATADPVRGRRARLSRGRRGARLRAARTVEDDPCSQPFFARDAREVALDLLGRHLKRGRVVLRITETEAYVWPDDTASHCRSGARRATSRCGARRGTPTSTSATACTRCSTS